ncbi:MAG: glycosyltransferase family 2 protein [Hydrogenophaga sp.]|uniref:glycosyltransferase family 2 protein n=1 Tax=Hydrogenophaga sp. TaxID=1904254 RepID=UPI00271CB910|nr:glycosyltransferase family 2 protein [Hydrogenophaga sp.]MDO9570288.1 glycosyltransferase family 2 protein [Hydrogenophaga sp.]
MNDVVFCGLQVSGRFDSGNPVNSQGGSMTLERGMKVHAIVVTFNPERDVLRHELELLAPQVSKIWLVDNASSQSLGSWVDGLGLHDKLQWIQMLGNLGLGAAQNAGMELARAAGASHVLLLDQDSQPSPDMVDRLLAASTQLQAAGVPVAALAPVYADSATGPASGFVRLGLLDFKKQTVLPGQDVVEADFVISSGSLIPVNMLDVIGLMDESLFIDHVDTEWCMRAQSKGYKLFGVSAARMVHTLGDKRTRIWFLRWRNVPYHSPFRYYYIFRNGLLLQRRPYIPTKWRIGEAFRAIRMLVFYSIWGAGRFARLKMMILGIIDGIRGISGRL